MKQKNKCGIYIITNLINKKVYIGQSSDIIGRLSTHKNLLRNKNKKENSHLLNSVCKYGLENFSFETLLLCSIDRLTLNEQIAKDYFEKTVGVYNQVGPVDSPNRGLKRSIETKLKIGLARIGNKNPMFGSGNNNYGGSNIKKMKSVERIEPQTGEVKEYSYIREVLKDGFDIRNIYRSIKKEHKAGGFFWRFL